MMERLKTKVSKVFCFIFLAGFKISNFNVWTAKHLMQASWTELALKSHELICHFIRGYLLPSPSTTLSTIFFQLSIKDLNHSKNYQQIKSSILWQTWNSKTEWTLQTNYFLNFRMHVVEANFQFWGQYEKFFNQIKNEMNTNSKETTFVLNLDYVVI